MKLRPVEIAEIDFSPYGRVFDMRNGGEGLIQSNGDGWSDCFTAGPLIDGPASLGNTFGSGAPFVAAEMEIHGHSREAQMCMDEPIVFLVAAALPGRPPQAGDAVAVILRPGYVAVLNKNVWHSASHGLTRPASYYWICRVCDDEPSQWAEIDGGPVTVLLEE